MAAQCRSFARLPCVVLLSAMTAAARAGPADERLPPELDGLVRQLSRRNMPELVEELLKDRPGTARVHIARAYAQAGGDAQEPQERRRFLSRAVEEYHRVLEAAAKPGPGGAARRDEPHQLAVAEWHVELGDLLFRRLAGPDLDQFEITSGLEFDRPGVSKVLREAHAAFAGAEKLLATLRVGLRTQEEHFLLLGIADRLERLADHADLSAAWTRVYLAMTGAGAGLERDSLLARALELFDGIARRARDPGRRYNALVGAAVALRESGRHEEALAAFDRVLASTAPAASLTRCGYEKARCLLAMRRYDDARRQLQSLAGSGPASVADASGSSAFYLRLAPLLGAYSFIVQAGQMGESAARQALLDQAVAGLEGISRQGTYPPRVVAVYRRHLPGAPQGITAMDDAGLRAEVAAEMAAGRYEQAIPLLNALLSRRPLSAEAGSDRFNLAVCNYHTGRLSAAVDQFLEIATRRAGTGSKPAGAGDVPDLAGRAIEYAYQCALQLARVSRARKDYALLARCATLLVEKLPNHPRADEARWAAALALQEAQDDAAAVSAFAAVPRTSGRYWAARRNEAACLQRIYENLPPDAPPQDRPVAARRALEAWMSVARDAAARSTSKGTTMPASPPAPDAINLVELAGMSTLAAASLLAGSDIAEYARALDVIDPLPASGRVLALRIRCLRGLGDASAARHALAEFLSRSAQEETGAVLGGLLAETEAQIDRLRVLGRRQEAARAASDMVPLLETLLAWVEGSPRHASHAGVVRASLANALHEAGRIEEAVTQLDAAQAAGPADLRVLHLAAVWAEETARQAGDRQKASAPPPAQARWGRLLEVPGIRETAPKVYWEARYHWLRYALDAGKAADVLNAIDSEKAWFPDLGGPPWQARLLELADQARAALAAGDTPSQPQKDPAGSGEPRR